jgi:hypothetical protein
MIEEAWKEAAIEPGNGCTKRLKRFLLKTSRMMRKSAIFTSRTGWATWDTMFTG